jgi:hypothetical protein
MSLAHACFEMGMRKIIEVARAETDHSDAKANDNEYHR